MSTKPWLFSLLGLTIISVVAILHETGDKDEKYAAIAVLTGVFPLMAALIGGILAHHASLSNFAMAANALRSFASPVEAPSNIPVTSAMIEANKIVGLTTLTRNQSAASITIQDLRSKFKSGVTRIPVVNSKGPIMYIIHESTLDKFLANVAFDSPPNRRSRM